MSEPTDTERLDFIERYLGRGGEIRNDNGDDPVPVHSWSVVTARNQTLRETIDTMMQQRERLTDGRAVIEGAGMSGLHDGVSTVWIVRHGIGKGLNFDGFKTLDEAALALLFMDFWKEGWEGRIQKFKEALDKRFAEATHEHEWSDAVEGPEVVGKVCSTCGAMQELCDD